MKIGIISDIHGGLDELNIALKHLNQAGVDAILCAGDLVDFGDYSDEVVQKIRAANIPCVQGNHDRRARQKQASRGDKALQEATLNMLDKLPLQRRFHWLNTEILLTHAAPWHGDMYIVPDSPLPLFRRVIKEAKADVTILGHTHYPMWIDVESSIIINPGSVSQNYYRDTGTYGILLLPDRNFSLFEVKTGKQIDLKKQSW